MSSASSSDFCLYPHSSVAERETEIVSSLRLVVTDPSPSFVALKILLDVRETDLGHHHALMVGVGMVCA